ncbi:unnamed protein product, partial [Didymodactylos carnosus]
KLKRLKVCDVTVEDHGDKDETIGVWCWYDARSLDIVEYDLEWPNIYKNEYTKIMQCLEENVVDHHQTLLAEIYHIGSTSIEGMCSKLHIDILILKANIRGNLGIIKADDIQVALQKLGYKEVYNGTNARANALYINVRLIVV